MREDGAGMKTLYVLQHYTHPKSITEPWTWDWDLSDIFFTESDAETFRIEWHSESATRIVRLVVSEEVVVEYAPEQTPIAPLAGQRSLF